jgi:hypothetical protein
MKSSTRFSIAAITLSAVMLGLGGFIPQAAQATAPKILYVSQSGLDSGTCPSTSPCATVSYALFIATSGATIEVSGTIDDHVTISKAVTITGADAPAGSPAVLDGTDSGGVIYIDASVAVTLDDLTIENGSGNTIGGIDNAGGTVTLNDSTVSGNSSNYYGAGIYNYSAGTMKIFDSTISGNTSSGGGIWDTGTMTILASTISGNTATQAGNGGGITHEGGTVNVGATIVAENTGGNCGGTPLTSAGYNLTNDTTGTACGLIAAHDLVNQNPLLGPLAHNGGPTETMLPAPTSPAVDAIPNPTTLSGVAVCPGTDQRGVARPGQGETRCSIGAVEVGYTIATTTAVTVIPGSVTLGTRVVYLVTVTPQSGTGTPTGKVTFTTGKKTLCSAVLSGGVAACGATTAPVGADTVTGTYSGGAGFAGSSGTATLTVTAS